jgi:hypothetical protein
MNKFWLNVFGKMIFQNKANKFLFAERSFRNIDRIIFIDDSRGFCENAGEGKFTEFNQDEWIPITREEFNMIKRSYREIEFIRQAILLNNQWKKINCK